MVDITCEQLLMLIEDSKIKNIELTEMIRGADDHFEIQININGL